MDTEPKYGMSTKVSVMTIATMFLITGTIGNVLVIAANRSRHMRTITNMFITQLAVGDLVILFFCMPFTLTSEFVLEGWPFGEITCCIVTFARSAGAFLSILTLTAMSVERYIMLVHPMKARTFWKKSFVAKIMVIIVLVSITCAIIEPVFIGIHKDIIPYTNATGHVTYKMVMRSCYSKNNMFFKLFRLIFLYLLPLVIISCLYGRIACYMSNQWSNKSLHSNEKVLQARKKVVYMLLVMILMFAVCWLPANIFYILQVLPGGTNFMNGPLFLPLILVTVILLYGNCITNPILYSFMSAQYRHEFRQMICRCVPEKKAAYSDTTRTNFKTSNSDISSTFKSKEGFN